PEDDVDEWEGSEDEFQEPADVSKVPEDDVNLNNVPINMDNTKRDELLRKIAATHWREILAITSFEKGCAIVFYSVNYDPQATGSAKSRANGYKRQAVSIWGNLVWLQSAYRNIVVTRASQMAHLQRRFMGLRWVIRLNHALRFWPRE
ncbi:unnamed protein product, partial [Rhizoctonia solani]